MTVRRFVIPAVGAADGSGTFYSPYLSGKIEAIQYVKTDYADTVDFTITADATGETIWTESNVTAAVIKHPRAATHSTAGVASVYAAAAEPVSVAKVALQRDRVKIVIGTAGVSKTGSFTVTVSN
jgi:hypothetical protein